MDRNKIYILSGVLALLVIMTIGFFYYGSLVSKNNGATAPPGTGPSTSGTGSLGTLPPSQTTSPPTHPAPPVLHSDASQPYATNAPRATEPAPVAAPVTFTPADQQYQAALAAGLLGSDTTQPAVSASGMDRGVAYQYNDLTSSNETQLMQKYTPNYQSIDQTFAPPANGAGGASGVAANGTDGVVTAAATTAPTSIPTVTLPPNVVFPVNNQNDPQSLTGYLAQLSSTVAPFDISNPANSALVSSAVTDAISNPSKYQADLAAGQNMLASLTALPVPSDMLGLQQSYYDLYTKYVTLMQDAGGLTGGNQVTVTAAGASIQQDAALFGASLETTLVDLNTAQAIVQNVQ
jgi:hypothetical protein